MCVCVTHSVTHTHTHSWLTAPPSHAVGSELLQSAIRITIRLATISLYEADLRMDVLIRDEREKIQAIFHHSSAGSWTATE